MTPRITAIHPLWAIEGGQVVISGEGFSTDPPTEVRIGGDIARPLRASASAMCVVVPPGLDGGRTPVRLDGAPGETAYLEVGAPLGSGLHLVDSPAFDRAGNLYVTFSGSRGQQAPISIFVVRRDGTREPFGGDVPNPTSMIFGPDGRLYVSSRFDGNVYRIETDGTTGVFATDLGVACGLAFDSDGALYVGDRSGTILRVSGGRARAFASIPPSVAAFHLAFGPDECLYVTGPTLAPRDAIYRIRPDGRVESFYPAFGRPQGLAFDEQGHLYVVEALAGASGVYRFRVDRDAAPELLLAGGGLIGIAFDPAGGVVLASGESVYRLAAPVRPLALAARTRDA